MKEVTADTAMIAYCGLYCGACRKYLSDTCPGCHGNEKAGWCKVRRCCMDNNFKSCADCTEFDDPYQCTKLNNFVAKIFALIFRSDRRACLDCIKHEGYERYSELMTKSNRMSFPRGGRLQE